MFTIILDTCLDVLKTVPVLLIVYALLYFLETRLRATPKLLEGAQRLGPFFGALAGAVPQCGFSAAAAMLYQRGWLAPATLVAVFVSTSDEAIPLLLAQPGAARNVALLICCKLVLAVAGGYALRLTLFRGAKLQAVAPAHAPLAVEGGCDCCAGGAFGAVLGRTLKTALYLLVSMLIISLAVHALGEARLEALLLSGSILQPALCALVGLVPGCAVSILLTQLFLGGSISFGAVLAGLSTGAGFGYVLLLREKRGRKAAWRIIAATYAVAVIGGTVVQVLLG